MTFLIALSALSVAFPRSARGVFLILSSQNVALVLVTRSYRSRRVVKSHELRRNEHRLPGSVDSDRLKDELSDVAITIHGPIRPLTVWKIARPRGPLGSVVVSNFHRPHPHQHAKAPPKRGLL
jgi:hypothetical protein